MNVKRVFGPPPDLSEQQVERLSKLQELFLNAAEAIVENTPNTPDRGVALEKLRESMLFAQAAIRTGRSVITSAVMADLFADTERWDTRVVRVWMNVYDFADVRKSCSEFDPTAQAVTLRAGIQGVLWNSEIRISKKIPVGQVVVIGEDQGDSDLDPNWTPKSEDFTQI